jgi:hypothetical protein
LLLFLAQFLGFHLFALVLEGACRSNNENGVFYQLYFYPINRTETTGQKRRCQNMLLLTKHWSREKHKCLMPDLTFDLTFTVVRLACQANLTSASSLTNWARLLNFFFWFKIPICVKRFWQTSHVLILNWRATDYINHIYKLS